MGPPGQLKRGGCYIYLIQVFEGPVAAGQSELVNVRHREASMVMCRVALENAHRWQGAVVLVRLFVSAWTLSEGQGDSSRDLDVGTCKTNPL